MLGLSIRQPFAELILRGVKTVEYRSRPTRVIGRRSFIYASKGTAKKAVWSHDLVVPGEALSAWMIELAGQVGMTEPGGAGAAAAGRDRGEYSRFEMHRGQRSDVRGQTAGAVADLISDL